MNCSTFWSRLCVAGALCLHAFLTGSAAEKADSQASRPESLAWRSTAPYQPPDFERFFANDPEGGKKLDALFRAPVLHRTADEEVFPILRQGLRTTQENRESILRWLGNKYVWNRKPQHPEAIEIFYHAMDWPGSDVVAARNPPFRPPLGPVAGRAQDPGRAPRARGLRRAIR